MNDSLNIRIAKNEDFLDLFLWRNNAHTISMSINKNKVLWEDHVVWLNKLLKENKSYLFLGILKNKKIGMVRFDFYQKKKYLVNINLNPDFRRKRLSSLLLKKSIEHLLSIRTTVSHLYAQVKSNNISSQKCFENNKFVLMGSNGEIKEYILSFKN